MKSQVILFADTTWIVNFEPDVNKPNHFKLLKVKRTDSYDYLPLLNDETKEAILNRIYIKEDEDAANKTRKEE